MKFEINLSILAKFHTLCSIKSLDLRVYTFVHCTPLFTLFNDRRVYVYTHNQCETLINNRGRI